MTEKFINQIYDDNYVKLLNTGSVGAVFEQTHKTLERGLPKKEFDVVLEIGAGQGQHVKFVKHAWKSYLETDIRLDLLKRATKSRLQQQGLEQAYADAEDLQNFGDESFDRVIVTCVLAHLKDAEKALLEWRRVLKPNGYLSIYIPSEPGFLLRVARTLTTVPKARKLGYNHLSFHYREHRNHFPAMKMLLMETFSADYKKWYTYPIPKLSWNFSLWKIVQIKKAGPHEKN